MHGHTHRILVIRTGAIGDFILTLPVLASLQRHYPDAPIDVMGIPSTLDLAVRGGYVQECIPVDRGDIAPFFVKNAPLPDSMATTFGRYDLILSYLPDPDGIFIENLQRTGNQRLLTHTPKPERDQRRHVTHHLHSPLRSLGITGPAARPALKPSDDDREWGDDFLRSQGIEPASQGVAAFHPGSGGQWKRWPVRRYARIINTLARRGIATLISAGPADVEVITELRNHVNSNDSIILDHLKLPALAGLLVGCRFMIGNDSGITHLAAAVGIPTIGLFGPTDPAVWGPRGERVRILWGNQIFRGDVGILLEQTPAPSSPPMSSITEENVLTVIEEVITDVSDASAPTG